MVGTADALVRIINRSLDRNVRQSTERLCIVTIICRVLKVLAEWPSKVDYYC